MWDPAQGTTQDDAQAWPATVPSLPTTSQRADGDLLTCAALAWSRPSRAALSRSARGPKTAAPARAQSQSLLGLPFLNQDVESPPQLRAAPWHCTWQLA